MRGIVRTNDSNDERVNCRPPTVTANAPEFAPNGSRAHRKDPTTPNVTGANQVSHVTKIRRHRLVVGNRLDFGCDSVAKAPLTEWLETSRRRWIRDGVKRARGATTKAESPYPKQQGPCSS